MKESRVRFVEPLEIASFDQLFEGDTAPRDALEQNIGGRLEVHDEVGDR